MGNIYKEYTPPSTGGSFLKFEDGKTYRLRIVSEPYVFQSEYIDKSTGESNLSTKYAWVVWNLDESIAQIMQLPVTGYRAIAAIGADEDWGDPLENPYTIKVTRTGKGTDTKYSVIASVSKADLPADAQEEIDGTDILGKLEAGQGVSSVMTLRDAMNPGNAHKSVRFEKAKQDTVVTDGIDEPINLDDIPFGGEDN